MLTNRTLVLDCASDRVSLGLFSSRRDGGLLCHHFATETWPLDSAPGAGDRWLGHVAAALRVLSQGNDVRGQVVLVLPAHLTLTKSIRIPRVGAEQQEKILRFEAAQHIPYALTDVRWAGVVAAETGSETEMLIVTAKLEVLDSLCEVAAKVGFCAHSVLPSPLASLAGFRFLNDKGAGTFLGISGGFCSINLALVEPGRFAVRSLLHGVSSGASGPGDNKAAGPAGGPAVGKLVAEIARTLLHFQWKNGLGKPTRIYVAGAWAGVSGFGEALAEKLQSLPVELCDCARALVFDGESAKKKTEGHESLLLDMIGAAATELFPGHAAVNLLPPRMSELRAQRKRRPWLLVAAVLMAGAFIPPLIHFRRVAREMTAESKAIEREVIFLRSLDLRMRDNLQQLGEVRQRIVLLEGGRERRRSWLRLLSGLEERLTQVEDVWLDELRMKPPVKDEPLRLVVSGRMLDRANPVAKVSSEAFSRVKKLLAMVETIPGVAAVESERFDSQQAGMLKFDFVLVLVTPNPL